MNAIQVYQEVADLVSEGRLDSEGAFYASLNRALDEVGRIDPMKKTFTIRHFPLPAVFRLPKPCTVSATSPLTVTALSSAAFALSGCGTGKLSIFSGGRMREEAVFSENKPFLLCRSVKALCGKSRAELTFVFSSEENLVLESFAVYERAPEEESEIPLDAEYTVYPVEKSVSDFLSFTGSISKDRFDMPDGNEVIFEDDALLIDNTCRGLYEIGYTCLPERAAKENAGQPIAIKKELQHLIPLLTAYYVCMEDSDARANLFLARYKEELLRYQNERPFPAQSCVTDVWGW